MSIRVRAGSYQVLVAPFPAKTLPTRQAAETVELDLKLKKKMGALYRDTPTTLGDEIDGHLDRKSARRPLRPASVEFFEKGARQWEPFRKTPLAVLRRAQIEDHLTRRAKVAPVAARNELQLLKSVLKEAASRGQDVDPGIFQIPAIRVEHAEGQALEPGELAALQAWMPDHVERIVPFVAIVGLRLNEALALADRMVDLAGATMTIPRDLNKSRRPKPIDLSQHETQLLREQMMARAPDSSLLFANEAGKRYTVTPFRRRWQAALTGAGLEGFKFHWLRHTAISRMAQAGMPVETIAQRVGHSDGGALILRRYRHLFPSEQKAAVALLDAYLDRQETDTIIPVAEGIR